MRIVGPFKPAPDEPRIYSPPSAPARPYEDGGWLGVALVAILLGGVAACLYIAFWR